ncbi:uncharacterized protein LOC143294532 [Babylonia areolata]|uniref:uncharacterized protein LOC143294532 n=1 Tax=Babylonia areolata TaxID=304850 RepID=UPI003FD3288D
MMGSGPSKGTVGVPANPRVAYSHELSKKEKSRYRIDAPVLVDMQHGSVRYREGQDEGSGSKTAREIPHEGSTELEHKKHYFYHTRLNHFGTDADKSKEEPFKFYYVTSGPARAQGKKLFYVYGQGWNAQDSLRVKPTLTMQKGEDFAWPNRCGPNDLLYSVKITGSTPVETADSDWEENRSLEDLESTPDRSQIRLKVKSDERVSSVKARLAVKLLKAASSILITHSDTVLRNEDVLGDLRPQEERDPAILDLLLTLV